MKICVIGVTYPIRGGISHYTSKLCKELEKKHEICLISFNRIYTSNFILRRLFPGKSEIDRDSSLELKYPVARHISPFGPISWIKAAINIRRFNPDIILFQYFHPILTPSYFFLSLMAKMKTKPKIVFECHNVLPHESTIFDVFGLKAATAFTKRFIVHSNQDKILLGKHKKTALIEVHPHPIYDIFKSSRLTKIKARKKLGLKGRIVLFFGYVKKYKGLEYLIRALPMIKSKLTVVIAGEFYDSKEMYLRIAEQLKVSGKLVIHDRYVKNEDVQNYFSAADVIVLPYISATQSGIIQIAYAFEKPVITTSVGGLAESVKEGKTGYIVKPGDSRQLAAAVDRFFSSKADFSLEIRKFRRRFSWESLAEAVIRVGSS